MAFSIIFIFLFAFTLLIEYKNKDNLKEKVHVSMEISEDSTINIPKTPKKVQANLEFSKFYLAVSLGITILTPVLFYKFGGIEIIKKKNIKNKFIEGGVLFIFYSVFSEIMLFPKSFFSVYYRGQLVGLQSYKNIFAYLSSYLLDGIVSFVILIPIVEIIYNIFLKKTKWYIIVLSLLIVFLVSENFLYPYIDEAENKLEYMEDSELKTELLDLAESVGIKNLDIRVVEKSKETNSMNAYMTGILSSKRIVFWDTTLNQLSDKEILQVAAHEMGHYKLNHIVYSMILNICGSIIGIFTLVFIMKKYKGNNYRKIDYIPHILFIITILTLIGTPIFNAYSRKIEMEADSFAISATKDPYINGELEIKFIDSNLSPIKISGFYKWFYYDHPSVEDRIELSNDYIKKVTNK